jgi:hypothetical protein
MYDRFSLSRLLSSAGFVDAKVETAGESRIPNWQSFGLDINQDGKPIKPDLLFVEAIKPGVPDA